MIVIIHTLTQEHSGSLLQLSFVSYSLYFPASYWIDNVYLYKSNWIDNVFVVLFVFFVYDEHMSESFANK